MRRLALSVLVAATCAVGCRAGVTDPGNLETCSDDVSVTVSAGTTPTFAWSPACRLFFLIVEPATSGADLWSIMTPGENALVPPVVYGRAPAFATELTGATALRAGVAYKVALARHTGPDGDDGVIIAMQTFTP